MLGEILTFAAPLVGEAVGLIGKYMAAKAEDRPALIARANAALAEMRKASSDEAQAHDLRTAETRRVIAELLP